MKTEEDSIRRVFSSTLTVSHQNYTLEHVEDFKYGHSAKRAFFEIVQKYNIPFEIEKRENGEWLHSKKKLSNTAEIILFIADNLNIRVFDVIEILEHLIQNNIIETSRNNETIESYYNKFKKINQFYESDFRNLNSDLLKRKMIDFEQETIIIKNINIDFYKNSSHAIKIVVDAVFYHMLFYIRNLHIKKEKINGKFKGLVFSFQGHEQEFYEQKKEQISIEKTYESFDPEAKNIKQLAYFNLISKYLRSKYGF